MVMFEPHYITKMLEIGEADAQMRLNDLATLLGVA
jgi:Mn-dependent DtxR family transcriptional regulator